MVGWQWTHILHIQNGSGLIHIRAALSHLNKVQCFHFHVANVWIRAAPEGILYRQPAQAWPTRPALAFRRWGVLYSSLWGQSHRHTNQPSTPFESICSLLVIVYQIASWCYQFHIYFCGQWERQLSTPGCITICSRDAPITFVAAKVIVFAVVNYIFTRLHLNTSWQWHGLLLANSNFNKTDDLTQWHLYRR